MSVESKCSIHYTYDFQACPRRMYNFNGGLSWDPYMLVEPNSLQMDQQWLLVLTSLNFEHVYDNTVCRDFS
jgi:hypothetical protein